jgi:1-acyl-sn-glycerol-3-phosphate acyltransferase
LAGGGILVFNHQSLFDIPVVISTTFKHIRFGAKIELFKVPFFGAAMRAAGTLPIARQNRNEVMRVYKEAEARFMRNTIFVLAPEGTRQKEPVLGRFKKGPFFFALSGGVPLIPVVIRGAHSVLPKQSLMVNVGRWTRKIHVEYLDPVITQGLGTAGVSELMNQVRDAMSDVYDRMPTGN